MTSRERVSAALSHKTPDHVPFRMRLEEGLEERFNKCYCGGANHADFFGDDVRSVNLCGNFIYPDWWNAPHKGSSVDTLPWPQEADFEQMRREVEALHGQDKAVFCSYTPGLYETMTGIFGDEDALVDMLIEPEHTHANIEKIALWQIELALKKIEAGIDILLIGDDLGTQRSLILGLDAYRTFYKPWHKRLIESAKKSNPAIWIGFHCCGHVMPLVPELIEIGVDILETVQPEANNDRKLLKREYGRDISFWGGIGMQSVFWNQTPDFVMDHVREAIELFSMDGGYICMPCHCATSDIAPANIKAFYDAVEKYG